MECMRTMRSLSSVVGASIKSNRLSLMLEDSPNVLCKLVGTCVQVLLSCLPHNEALTARVQWAASQLTTKDFPVRS